MRTYGRTTDKLGRRQWVEVTTDVNGSDDFVWLVTLQQVLLLNLNESPFYANYGIPAQQSVVQQIYPDYYVALTQIYFAAYFAYLSVAKIDAPEPMYNIVATLNNGVSINEYVPVPQ